MVIRQLASLSAGPLILLSVKLSGLLPEGNVDMADRV